MFENQGVKKKLSNQETVTVKIRIPKNVIEMLRALEKDPQKYLEYSIIQVVKADLDAGILASKEALIEKYGLEWS